MKILEIITPHETLNEAGFKDALKGAFDKWVAEPIAIAFGKRRPPKKVVADLIDGMLGEKDGEVIPRSPELKQAESRLVAIYEKSPYPDDMVKIDAISDSLASYMAHTNKTTVPGTNSIETLYKLVQQDAAPVPKSYGSKQEFLNDTFVTTEIRGLVTPGGQANEMGVGRYVRELTEAKVSVRNEVAKVKDPNVAPVSKAIGSIKEYLKQNLTLKKLFAPTRVVELKTYFYGFEAWKIIEPALEQAKLIDEWSESKTGMPDNVAQHFPPVPTDLPAGSHVTSINTFKEYTYSTKDERYAVAANWAYMLIAGKLATQIALIPVSFGALNLVSDAGGAAGKLKWVNFALKKLAWLGKSKMVNAYIAKMTPVARYLFVDYMTTAANGSWQSNNLGKQLQLAANKLGIEPVRNYPEIPNSIEALSKLQGRAILDLDNPAYAFLEDALAEMALVVTVPGSLIVDGAIWAVANALPAVVQAFKYVVPKAGFQELPGATEVTPKRPPSKPEAPASSAASSTANGAGDEVSSTAPPPPASSPEVPPAKVSKPASPSDDPDSIFDIKRKK